MAEEKEVLSEQTRDMTPEQRTEQQETFEKLTPEEKRTFRNETETDGMGFAGEEGV